MDNVYGTIRCHYRRTAPPNVAAQAAIRLLNYVCLVVFCLLVAVAVLAAAT